MQILFACKKSTLMVRSNAFSHSVFLVLCLVGHCLLYILHKLVSLLVHCMHDNCH